MKGMVSGTLKAVCVRADEKGSIKTRLNEGASDLVKWTL